MGTPETVEQTGAIDLVIPIETNTIVTGHIQDQVRGLADLTLSVEAKMPIQETLLAGEVTYSGPIHAVDGHETREKSKPPLEKALYAAGTNLTEAATASDASVEKLRDRINRQRFLSRIRGGLSGAVSAYFLTEGVHNYHEGKSPILNLFLGAVAFTGVWASNGKDSKSAMRVNKDIREVTDSSAKFGRVNFIFNALVRQKATSEKEEDPSN